MDKSSRSEIPPANESLLFSALKRFSASDFGPGVKLNLIDFDKAALNVFAESFFVFDNSRYAWGDFFSHTSFDILGTRKGSAIVTQVVTESRSHAFDAKKCKPCDGIHVLNHIAYAAPIINSCDAMRDEPWPTLPLLESVVKIRKKRRL